MVRTGPGQRVAVAYDSFPHYRKAVNEALAASDEHRYVFVADQRSVDPTIKKWTPPEGVPFITARCRSIGPLRLQWGLIPLALRRDLDAIIYLGNAAFACTWLSAILARLTGKRVLFWTHGWIERDRGFKRWFRTTFYRLSHGLLLYGHWGKVLGIEAGLKPERLHVIYNSMDVDAQIAARSRVTPEAVRGLRAELFEHPGRPLVICTVRPIPGRQLGLLLDALAELKASGEPVNLLHVGDGPELTALKDKAQRLGLDAHFHGPCYDEDRLAVMIAAADVTVVPARTGLTATHSMTYGTPAISHDDPEDQGPEWEAIIPGKTGGLYRRGDAKDLARSIREWIRRGAKDEATVRACHAVIDRFYNPRFQRRAIDRAVRGEPADDLWWMKEDGAN